MNVEALEELLKSDDTKIIRTLMCSGQDPFVLYPKKFRLQEFHFVSYDELRQAFGGKNIVVADCLDNYTMKVFAYVSNPAQDFAKIVKLKRRMMNEQATNKTIRK